MPSYVIVGASLAGAKAAETLRDEGFDGDIVLIGAETERPYERPPLSKGYLLGNDRAGLGLRARRAAGTPSTTWTCARGSPSPRSTPARAPWPPPAGGELACPTTSCCSPPAPRRAGCTSPVPTARRCSTCARSATPTGSRSAFQPGTRVVVAGAGWIGLETAAAARTAGCAVTVLEPQPGALHRPARPRARRRLRRRCTGPTAWSSGSARRPVEFRPGMVITSGGAEIPADLLVVGIGAAPNDDLAARAGLETGNGVLTDEALRTSDPDIFAAGDVANSFHPLLGRRVRVEHWANALNGGPAAARSMLGQAVRYDPVPYFYSDQYDLGMECAGLPSPGTLRPGPLPRRPRHAWSSSRSGSPAAP